MSRSKPPTPGPEPVAGEARHRAARPVLEHQAEYETQGSPSGGHGEDAARSSATPRLSMRGPDGQAPSAVTGRGHGR